VSQCSFLLEYLGSILLHSHDPIIHPNAFPWSQCTVVMKVHSHLSQYTAIIPVHWN